jgi:hypothetical protein
MSAKAIFQQLPSDDASQTAPVKANIDRCAFAEYQRS